jgi:uncharacterized protein YcbK (DUF882 family)
MIQIRRRAFLAAAAALIAPGRLLAAPAIAPLGVRRLLLVNTNTGESFRGPYRNAEGPIAEAMQDLSRFLRDHRAGQATPIDVAVIDFLHDVLQTAGAQRATILSGYRTRETNAALAASHFGVADLSQHIFGRAIDVRFDGNLERAASTARAMNRGGVGWYPRSGFIHLDSGPVRTWTFQDRGLSRVLLAGGRVMARPPAQPPERPQRSRLYAFNECRLTRSGCAQQYVFVLRGRR